MKMRPAALALIFLAAINAVASGPSPFGRVVKACGKISNVPNCAVFLMEYRCLQIFPFSPADSLKCATTARDMIKIMDFDQALGSTGAPVTAFSNELIHLFVEESTGLYLDHLISAERATLIAGKTFNFFQFTYQYFNRDLSKTLQVLAVLFQDSFLQYHVSYLFDFGRANGMDQLYFSDLEKLSEANALMQGQVQRSMKMGESPMQVDWPKERKVDYFNLIRFPSIRFTSNDSPLSMYLNKAPYHFYISAYLANRLEKIGHSKRMSAFLPYLFNLDYELKDVENSKWPLYLPSHFNMEDTEPVEYGHEARAWKMEDIYAGYTGSLFGAGLSERTIPPFEFRKRVSTDTFGFLREVFETL